jgi:hypothetical protein
MPIDTTTDKKVSLACSKFLDAKSVFWHVAAHYSSDHPKSVQAEKQLKARANQLMQSLLGFVLEE